MARLGIDALSRVTDPMRRTLIAGHERACNIFLLLVGETEYPVQTRSSGSLLARTIRALALPALLGTMGLASCAQNQVKVESAWQGNASRGQTFTRVLVVGASPDIDARCSFEWATVAHLRSETVQAVASCDSMSLKEPLTRETIERAVAKLGADSVLATSLVAVKYSEQEGGGSSTRGAGYYKAADSGPVAVVTGPYYGYYGGYGVSDANVIYGAYQTAEPLTAITGQAHVSTRLYETGGKTLVYSLDTKIKAHDLESHASGLAIVGAAIADRLRRDGLIR